MFKPRPLQEEVLNYSGGWMGVSAVPGSGKTQTLSYLAARLIAEGRIAEDQEVLIVTLVNSAVDNFARRVAAFIAERGLLPHVGYRVRTLHGLAHDIVRERPELANLSGDFAIIDERAAEGILRASVDAWIHSNQEAADLFLDPDRDDFNQRRDRRERWPELVMEIAGAFIKTAKDMQLTPAELRQRLEESGASLPLVEMGAEVYADYQRALAYRGAVDFDDLIRLALQVLLNDPDYLSRLRRRWPYILEDEAQDSSRLQEEILRLLAGEGGNWVRVGDPNQSIYETFTTASPKFLIDFLKREDVESRELPNSGRSTASILRLANFLIDWSRDEHPVEELRGTLTLPYILPTPPGDPQPNPPDDPGAIHLFARKLTPAEELNLVADSLASWIAAHPDGTVAALVPRNDRGAELVEALKARRIPYIEILKSTHSTREAADRLGKVVEYLGEPGAAAKLANALRAWQRPEQEDEVATAAIERGFRLIRKLPRVEDYLWPRPQRDWLEESGLAENDNDVYELLVGFRELVQRWQSASLLPIEQLILTLAQDLFDRPADLAVAHKLAGILRQTSNEHPEWDLTRLSEELLVIARNERKMLGLSDEDTGFDPERHKGKVVVATMHKAKGLEWDRVYLLSVNSYDFPSGQPGDSYIAEKYFVRGHLNLTAETLSQLQALIAGDPAGWNLEEGVATRQARLAYAAERLRLLYVGITRAKKELIVTWNSGQRGDQQPAAPFIALQTFWEKSIHAAAETG